MDGGDWPVRVFIQTCRYFQCSELSGSNRQVCDRVRCFFRIRRTGRPGKSACGACCGVRFLWSLTLGFVCVSPFFPHLFEIWGRYGGDMGHPYLLRDLRTADFSVLVGMTRCLDTGVSGIRPFASRRMAPVVVVLRAFIWIGDHCRPCVSTLIRSRCMPRWPRSIDGAQPKVFDTPPLLGLSSSIPRRIGVLAWHGMICREAWTCWC